MRKADGKVTFGLVVGTRGFFNSELATEGRRSLVRRMNKLGYGYVILPEAATPTGAIETREDAAKCARLFGEHRDEIDGVVVVLPNFGDEVGIVQTLEMARLDVPVLVQACDDDLDKLGVLQRRDAFCGKLSVCCNLYQYGIPFTDTTLHTCRIESAEFAKDLDSFARVCRVVRGLKRARIGAIGARPPAFQTMRSSEKLLQASGITVVTVDLSDIIFGAERLASDAAEVKKELAALRRYGKIPASVPRERLLKQAKLSVAVNRWIAENEINAAGFQCWTSIERNYGCAACATLSMLSNRLVPCSCEVDVCGAISMYALALASGNPAALLDWNNNYGDERDKCLCTHCSNFPKEFVGGEVEISNLDVLGVTLGQENCFGAVKGKVVAGPMTYCRVSTDDRRGMIRTYVGDGEFTDDPAEIDGGAAVCKFAGVQSLMKHVCANGFEHHVAMVRTHVAGVIEEAFGKYLKWDVYRHGA
jgi:L-fucose isomerase-like protein